MDEFSSSINKRWRERNEGKILGQDPSKTKSAT